jgi:hypothetical protein
LKQGGHFVPRMLLRNLSLGVPTVWYSAALAAGGMQHTLSDRPRGDADSQSAAVSAAPARLPFGNLLAFRPTRVSDAGSVHLRAGG